MRKGCALPAKVAYFNPPGLAQTADFCGLRGPEGTGAQAARLKSPALRDRPDSIGAPARGRPARGDRWPASATAGEPGSLDKVVFSFQSSVVSFSVVQDTC